jgi:cysteinyl-tRNA synthetase
MRWPSPWGEGFPGWHLECSVMSTKYLGDEFDIHGGGLDLVFPHHECELAQARAAGKPFARVWLHWNMLTLGGEKMSKSKGHVVELVPLFERHDPVAVRFHLLRSHYRSVSDFADDALASSAQGLQRLRQAYAAWRAAPAGRAVARRLAEARARFAAAMDDDLHTPEAIAVLFDVAREANRALERGEAAAVAAAADLFDELLEGVLGVPPAAVADDGSLMAGVTELLLEQRQAARRRRDFASSDAIRDRLAELGIVVEDTPDGSRWRRSS